MKTFKAITLAIFIALAGIAYATDSKAAADKIAVEKAKPSHSAEGAACCLKVAASCGVHQTSVKEDCCGAGASCCATGAACCDTKTGDGKAAKAAKASCCVEGAACCTPPSACCDAKSATVTAHQSHRQAQANSCCSPTGCTANHAKK